VEPFGENNKEKEYLGMKKSLILLLAVLLTGVAVLGAQEEGPPPPPPPPEGLTFNGSVITGLRWRHWVGGRDNVFDIDAGDDYLVEGDTAALRGALNKGTYGANFGLSLTANNTEAQFWTPDRIYASEASLWANFLNNKLGVKTGFFGDFDYFTPVLALSLGPEGGTDALQLTAYPIDGLRIDVRTRNSPNNKAFMGPWGMPVWYDAEQFGRNIDAGVKYTNPNFTVFAAFDDTFTPASGNPFLLDPNTGLPTTTPDPTYVAEVFRADAFAYFAFTGVPKLTVGLEGRFIDLMSERKEANGDATGITIATALNASYQITDAFSARIWLLAGAVPIGGSMLAANELMGEEGFTTGVDVEVAYKLNDLTFSLRPIFQIEDATADSMKIDFSVKPRVSWAIASMPYAATVNCWYMFRYYGKDGVAYGSNNNEEMAHSIAVTFGWNF
jgi:hypothetical protein